MDYVCRAVWGMLFTDDACIVLSSSRGLAMLMQAIVEVCRVFTLPVSEKNRESMCVNSTGYISDVDAGRSGRANLQIGVFLHRPEGSHYRPTGYVF